MTHRTSIVDSYRSSKLGQRRFALAPETEHDHEQAEYDPNPAQDPRREQRREQKASQTIELAKYSDDDHQHNPPFLTAPGAIGGHDPDDADHKDEQHGDVGRPAVCSGDLIDGSRAAEQIRKIIDEDLNQTHHEYDGGSDLERGRTAQAVHGLSPLLVVSIG